MNDIIEIMARAAFVSFSRLPDAGDRWDAAEGSKRRVTDLVKEQFRNEQRAALSALQAAGYDIVQRQRRAPF